MQWLSTTTSSIRAQPKASTDKEEVGARSATGGGNPTLRRADADADCVARRPLGVRGAASAARGPRDGELRDPDCALRL